MIEITRRLAMQLRPVFRQALNLSTRGMLPPLTFQTGPDGLWVRSRLHDAAVEYHMPGDHPIEQIPVPFELLSDSEARRDDLVQLEMTSDGHVVAQWRDGNVPQITQYDAPDPVDAAEFPRLPKKAGENPPGLLKALHDAMQTTDPEAVRYATNCVQLRGTAGQIVATDGRQLLVQSGFEFPWKDDLLVPRTKVFGSRELPQGESVQIGVSGKWFAVRIGPWRVFREINSEGRFPDVRHHVPQAKDAGAQFQLPPADADFLRKNLPKLPGDDEYNLPVTVDLNGQVVVRSKAGDQAKPTELVLSNTTLSGDPVRLNMNRQYLARALQLGFRQVHVYSPKVPVLCEDEGRQYVWALLDPQSALAPAEDAIRITSAEAQTEPRSTDSRPRRRKSTRMSQTKTASEGRAKADNRSQATSNGKADQDDVTVLIEQAEAVKVSLREALSKTSELVAALKRHRKQSKLVASTLQSLRRLQTVDA